MALMPYLRPSSRACRSNQSCGRSTVPGNARLLVDAPWNRVAQDSTSLIEGSSLSREDRLRARIDVRVAANRIDVLGRTTWPAALGALLLTAQLVAPRPAAAQEAPRYELGELVVSIRRPVIETVGTVRTVSAADIEASGARTLEEALQLLPGLDVRTGGEGVPRIDVRGFRPRHVLLLLDGIPFNTAVDGQADPTLIPVENIAMIKMSGGTGSVLYAEGGLGGVINIITKKGRGRVAGTATAEARERNAWLGKGTVSGGWSASTSSPAVAPIPAMASRRPSLRRATGPRPRRYGRTAIASAETSSPTWGSPRRIACSWGWW